MWRRMRQKTAQSAPPKPSAEPSASLAVEGPPSHGMKLDGPIRARPMIKSRAAELVGATDRRREISSPVSRATHRHAKGLSMHALVAALEPAPHLGNLLGLVLL